MALDIKVGAALKICSFIENNIYYRVFLKNDNQFINDFLPRTLILQLIKEPIIRHSLKHNQYYWFNLFELNKSNMQNMIIILGDEKFVSDFVKVFQI